MRTLRLERLFLGSGILIAALALLRVQIMMDLGLGLAQASRLGLHLGLLQDALAVTLLAGAVVGGAAVLGRWWRPVWSFLAVAIWLASLSGVVYFRVFGGLLEWWVVRYQYSDVPLIWDTAVKNGRFALALVSGLLTMVSAGLVLWPLRGPDRESPIRVRAKDRLRLLGVALALFALGAGIHETRRWLLNGRASGGSSILTNQLVFDWFAAIRASNDTERSWDWRRESRRAALKAGAVDSETVEEIHAVLVEYRDGLTPAQLAASRSEGGPTQPPRLDRRLEYLPGETAGLRDTLGLPQAEPVNIVLLFVESLRSLELFHPEIGALVYPRTRNVLQRNGITFRQAYSSSFRAGQTVRGQFSTLCSLLPNMKGVAAYIGYPRSRVQCLAQVLENGGYHTLWLSPFDRSHHNKYLFERLHGTEYFFDELYFRARGVSKRVGKWGLADREFLEQSLAVLEEFSRQRRPFFASMLTTTSHPPYSIVDEGALPADLVEHVGANSEYLAYLSTMRYVDEALGAFFERFFHSGLAENTLVILEADHSTGVRSHLELSPLQLEEMRFRVPIALVTAGLGEAREVHYPVHQVDVAPTAAGVAGVSDVVSWVGRSLLSGEGTPWVYEEGGVFHYRTRERACYTLVERSGLACFRASDRIDPLFATSLEPVDEVEGESAFYRGVVEATSKAIELDVLFPEGSRSKGE